MGMLLLKPTATPGLPALEWVTPTGTDTTPALYVMLPSGNGDSRDARVGDVLNFRDNGVAWFSRTLTQSDLDTAINLSSMPALSDGAHALDVELIRGSRSSGFSDVANGSIDTTAPTLSSPTATTNGPISAALSVSTNEGNGTIYWVVTPGAQGAPSASQVIAGLDVNGAPAVDTGTQTVTATGVQNITGGAAGLSAGTQYKAHYVHRDVSGNTSSVASSAAFTTETWSPAVLIGGVFWDAGKITTLWQDTARTSQVSASGQLVAAWDDQLQSTIASQNTGANRMTYQAGAGIPYLDSASDSLYFGAPAASLHNGVNASTIIAGIQLGDLGNAAFGIFEFTNWSLTIKFGLHANSAEQILLGMRRTNEESLTYLTSPASYINQRIYVLGEVNWQTGAAQLFINNALVASMTYPSTGILSGNNASSNGIGSQSNGNGAITSGRFYFLQSIPRLLTTQEKNDFATWAQARLQISF